MKAVLIALAMIVGPQAFAAQDCTPYADPTWGGDSPAPLIYPCGPNYTVHHKACKEGEVAYDSVLDPTGNFYQQVPVVCHNGTFAPSYRGNVQHRGCTEGEYSYSSELDPTGNFYQNVTLICRNGQFVHANQ